MGYDIFNAIAHLAMLLLVFEIFALIVVPALGIGLVGVLGLRFARRRLAGPIASARKAPGLIAGLIDRACGLAAWPVIQTTSLWRGSKTALASLRRQASSQ